MNQKGDEMKKTNLYCDHCYDDLSLPTTIFNDDKLFCSQECYSNWSTDRARALRFEATKPSVDVVIKKEDTNMDTKYDCPQCNDKYTQIYNAPFCSSRCENIYLEFAPTKMIAKIYREFNGLGH